MKALLTATLLGTTLWNAQAKTNSKPLLSVSSVNYYKSEDKV